MNLINANLSNLCKQTIISDGFITFCIERGILSDEECDQIVRTFTFRHFKFK